ncbi:unnamed protein product [Candidula unifasciata]|uniref:Uncharacterized protein n=1 Tax=Candidula unifasciata TaxID=100452 RepID=A0A8S3Z9G9_9EUPU|nr:unnamed protein product [Candidula unifasciata]
MFGRLFFLLVGVYSGVLANQKYRIPEVPTPTEAWERAKARFEERRRSRADDDRKHHHHPWFRKEFNSDFHNDPEVKDIFEKMKALQNKYWTQGRLPEEK